MHIFTGDFNFKGLTARRLYKLFGVKGFSWVVGLCIKIGLFQQVLFYYMDMTVNTSCQQKVVLKVPTLGHKSTNMQSTDFHSPAGQQYNSGLIAWGLHDIPL
jgi:hypothetical protein